MKTKLFSLSIVAASLLVLMNLTASAQVGPGQQRFFRDQGDAPLGRIDQRREMRTRLGLTNEQMKKLRDLRLSSAKTAIPPRATLQIKRLELQQLMLSDKPDRVAIDRKVKEISDARAALMMIHIDRQLAVREILTPEQREKLAEMRADLRARRFERQLEPPRGWRPGPGRPPGPLPPGERPPAPPAPPPAPPQ